MLGDRITLGRKLREAEETHEPWQKEERVTRLEVTYPRHPEEGD